MGKQGFTLAELTVVIAILAILAGIAVPAMAGYRHKAADGVNEANLLAAQRQLRMLWVSSREDFREVPRRIRAEEEAFVIGSWVISAPKALGVRSGDHPVEAGTQMRAWLDENEQWTTGYEDGEDREAGEAVEAEPTEATGLTVPQHDCRDRGPDYDCICDVEGCAEAVHEEDIARGRGNCIHCGSHFRHVGMEDQICDSCNWDETSGAIHVCSWEDGACRCRCGISRCEHGGVFHTGACRYCLQENHGTSLCPNCN